MIKQIRTFFIKLFQPFIEMALLRRIRKSQKEFDEGKGKLLKSLKDLR